MSRHLEAQEAELSVLGGILLDNGVFDLVAGVLGADDFFALRNRHVFKHMVALQHQQQPLDAVTLATALEQAGELEDAGGRDYLLTLSQATATAVNIEHHARIVREAADTRRLVQVCAGIVERAQGGDYEDTHRLFDEAQQAVFEIGQTRTRKQFTGMSEALKRVVERVKRAYEEKRAVTGVPTGFYLLDKMTSGLQGGDLIILAARPAMGKTALALNLATNAASLGGISVALFSLEMPTVQLGARMLASESRIDSERMRNGQLTEGDIDRILQGFKRMQDWPVFIDDTPAITVMEARSKCRRLASDKSIAPLGLILIDYLQLMKGPPHIHSREQQISDISRNLKGLAKELEVPVVALSQLNRGVESRPNKRPLLSDLRESGAIEQDADIIMFVYRDDYYNEDSEDAGLAEVIVGKNRSGSTGTAKLKFTKQWTRFDNLQPDS